MEAQQSVPPSLLNIMRDPEEQAAYGFFRREEGMNATPVSSLLAVPADWDENSNQWIPEEPSRSLENAIRDAQALGIGTNINIDNCTWDQVREARSALQNVMERAKENYNTKGSKSIPRRLLRKGAILNQAVAPLVSLIPDEKGINVLRAGLSMVFAALERRESNRDKIFEAFEDIGDILEDAERIVDPSDNPYGTGIRGEAVALYTTVLQELPKLLVIIDPKSVGGHGHNFMKRTVSHLVPGIDSKAIGEIIDKIKRPYKRLEQHITFLCHRKLLELGDIGPKLMQYEATILQRADATHHIVTNLVTDMGVLIQRAAEMDQKLDDIKKDKTQNNSADSEMLKLRDAKLINGQAWQGIFLMIPKWAMISINGIYQSGCDMQRTRDYLDSHGLNTEDTPYPRLLDTPTSSFPKRQRPTVASILRAIDAPNPIILNQDLIRVFSDGTTMEEEVLKRARWLLAMPRFKSWMTSRESDYLLVDGDCASTLSPRTSGLSVVCASLLATIRGLKQQIVHGQTIALGFFCGQHARLSDESESDSSGSEMVGPLGILRSLIAQLITYPGTPPWRFGVGAWYGQGLGSNEPEAARAMIRILQALIAQLPSNSTVFIIIDGLRELEGTLNADWDDALDEVVSGLIGIENRLAYREVYIKPLFTCAGRCLAFEKAPQERDGYMRYGQEEHHVGLWAGMADSRAGVASEFGADFESLFGVPTGDEDDVA